MYDNQNKTINKISSLYLEIRKDCAIITASDSKHAPYLFNAIASLKINFPDHPKVIIYDLGLTQFERHEIQCIKEVELRKIENFVSHWRANWSWKLYALTNKVPRYYLYLDLPNFVILRSLATWFLAIKKNGYLLISNGQTLGDIVPEDFWSIFKLDKFSFKKQPTFGAGVIGVDSSSASYSAIELAMNGVLEGLNLGRSKDELSANYSPKNLIRDCLCFRADQTLLNLAFNNVNNFRLKVRQSKRYTGDGGFKDHPNQYLWYSRRANNSLGYIGIGIFKRGFLSGIFYTHLLIKAKFIRSLRVLFKKLK